MHTFCVTLVLTLTSCTEKGAFKCDWEIYKFFRVSSRDFYRQTGRDAVQGHGVNVSSNLGAGNIGVERAAWERQERASDQVLASAPDISKWAAEYDKVASQQAARAKAQSRVWRKEQAFLYQILSSIRATFNDMPGTKRPVILLGRDGGHGQGVKGTRGHCATTIISFLAQFFLILTVGEMFTTRNCPGCHQESVFAKRSEIRSKRCKNPDCQWVNSNTGMPTDLCYDRDFGAVRMIRLTALNY